LKKITSIADMEAVYRRRVPRLFRDYATEGSWSGQTANDNVTDFRALRLRQRVGINIEERSTVSQMLGERVAMPVATAPVGFTGMQRAEGEIKVARAAEKFGVPFTLSTMSICSIEDVAAHTQRPFWFQLYVMRDRDFVSGLLDRARAAGCSALMITVDMQVASVRHNEVKNGLSNWPRLSVAATLEMLTKLKWCSEMLGAGKWTLGNVVGHAEGVKTLNDMNEFVERNYDPSLTWDDIAQISSEWGGKVILKGILDPEDAELAKQAGADAIVVSNHGGRQLDGALSSIRAVAAVAESVGNDFEIYLDGGIRSGQDVLKALGMGAQGALIGRAFTYALGAYGEPGVAKALNILQNELEISMALCGRRKVHEVTPDIVIAPDGPT